MISKERVREIVREVLLGHLHGEWSEIAQEYVYSKWDKELLTINKEISKRIKECEDECEICPYKILDEVEE